MCLLLPAASWTFSLVITSLSWMAIGPSVPLYCCFGHHGVWQWPFVLSGVVVFAHVNSFVCVLVHVLFFFFLPVSLSKFFKGHVNKRHGEEMLFKLNVIWVIFYCLVNLAQVQTRIMIHWFVTVLAEIYFCSFIVSFVEQVISFVIINCCDKKFVSWQVSLIAKNYGLLCSVCSRVIKRSECEPTKCRMK